MIKKIIEFSANNKFFIIIFILFLCLYAYYILSQIKLDALPDLSDTQVIVYAKWARPPQIIEDQVTYPIITSLLGAPKVKDIRGFTDFGFAFIYIIFQDGTDIYWARSRTLEYLSKIQGELPEGVKIEIGPDATGLGWAFQYALIDKTGKNSIDNLRSFQDWTLKYAIQSVEGVAEVASVGGYVKQYQITVDPKKLFSYKIGIEDILEAIKKSNNEVGGKLIEFSGYEFMVRSRGYVKNLKDLENIVLKVNEKGTPILLKNIANVSLGPEIRRGAADLDGLGESVGGIVVMRYGENALNVIKRVKEKIEEIKPSLPEGVEIVTTYDRSDLIKKSIDTLKHELKIEMMIVSLVILIFLWHIPSSIVPIITIPISVFLTFIPLYFMRISVNIMSLSGIAISIGVLVDGSIVLMENAYSKIQKKIKEGSKEDFHKVTLEAMIEVAPSIFFSLLVIAVAFTPIFALVDQEGRLFKPLAWSKNLTMLISSILAITLNIAVRMLFARVEPYNFKPKLLSNIFTKIFVGTYISEERHPISKILFKIYEPVCRFILKNPKKVIFCAIFFLLFSLIFYFKLGHEFMPPLGEGTILYMPTTFPGISIAEAKRILQKQDEILKSFPEVERVFGKAGRAITATDPAPLAMFETTIILKDEKFWREKKRWYSSWAPELLKKFLRIIWRDKISYEELINEMDEKMRFLGITNAWTMPIKGRIDMLSTGIRTPIGIKIFGDDFKKIEEIGVEIERNLKNLKGSRSVFSERVTGGYYLDIIPIRENLARYGLKIDDLNMVLTSAIGGENVTFTIEGRERYPVNLRYPRELRDNLENLKRVLISTPLGYQIPLEQVAKINLIQGPAMVRDENGFLTGYVYVDISGRDIGGYVSEAKELIKNNIVLPKGYHLKWSGQYENMIRVKEKLRVILPITIFLIFLLIYANTKSYFKTFVILLAIPFSATGAIWLFYILDYNVSIAAWVGMIALLGLDAETGIFMLLFLDLSYEEYKRKGLIREEKDLDEAIVHGAVKRIRPKFMTVMTTFMGLIPIMFSTGTGADLMKRIAAPMVGGLITSFLLELLIYPAIYKLWKKMR